MNADYGQRIRNQKLAEVKGITNIHDARLCMGQWCVFHDPSDHHMREWPMTIRKDPYDLHRGLIERICEHNIGHPDPDSAEYFVRTTGSRSVYGHGCDGCCAPPLHDQQEVEIDVEQAAAQVAEWHRRLNG